MLFYHKTLFLNIECLDANAYIFSIVSGHL
jgi:hypothetical protein